MKRKILLIAILVFVMATPVMAQNNSKKPKTKTETSAKADSSAMMKAWENYMTPGDMHKMMASFNGEWNEDITMWMSPDAPPTKSQAKVMNKMVLGGRYQESHHTGNFNGMPFEGFSMTGYDNATNKFVSTWVDNMGTGIMYMEGTWDEKSKTLTMKGKQTDPMTGKEMEIRETMKVVDNNTQLMEMYCTQDGKEFKTMEMRLTRKK